MRENDPIHASQYLELSALMREANARDDLGAGAIWSPETGDGIRPSSIYARGVSSLYTADIEIESIAGAQTRVKSPVAHFIVSLNCAESRTVSDEQLIRFTEATLDGMGLTGHAAIFAVHQDTMTVGPDGEPLGNKHCHVAMSSIHTETLRAMNRKQDNMRLSKSLREQEIAFGLSQDWGLYKTAHPGLPEQMVVRTNLQDWETRHRERAEARIDQLARNFLSDSRGLETERDREDRLIHGIRQYLDRCRERKEKPLASDVLNIAGKLTYRYEGVADDGRLAFRLYERGEPQRSTWINEFEELQSHERKTLVATNTIAHVDPARVATSLRSTEDGQDALAETRAFLQSIGTAEEAEAAYRSVIAKDPGRVTRDLVYGNGRANFTADDIDALLALHMTEGWSQETDRVLREDPTIKVLSADSELPLLTIETQQTLTQKFDRLLRELLAEKDPLFDRDALERAKAVVEAQERAKNPTFAFTAQQQRALDSFENRLAVWMGEAGGGKTLLNAVHREYAAITGREIRGFATAQKAATVLGEASGIQSVNQARALVEADRDGVPLIPQDARFVFDEFSMASIESGVAILERAIASNASGVLQGDLAQLANIAAGNTFGLATRAALDAKSLVRLTDVFRQREGSEVEWMRLAVPKGGKAIRTAKATAFAAYLEDYMDRGHVIFHETREQEVAAIASDIVDAMRAGQRVIAPGRSYQDCLYVSREVREQIGLAGTGQEFTLERGVMEIAAGDRILFRKNERRFLNVNNGDTATVRDVVRQNDGSWLISADLDNGKTVAFRPDKYRHIEYAYSTTIHANQGTGAPAVIGSITKGDDARSVHVTMTRTESVLHVHTHLKRDDILERLTSERSLSAKDDALLFDAIVKRTGGPNTPWAVAVKKAQEYAEDPLRQRHQAIMAQRNASLRAELVEIMKRRDLKTRERDRLLQDAAERLGPQSFVVWAASERATLEQEWNAKQQTTKQRHERTASRPRAQAPRQSRPAPTPEPPAQRKGRRR